MNLALGRLTLTLALAAGLLAASALPAAANPPNGDWTLVNSDGYKHYACKQNGKGEAWRLKTATWYNGRKGNVRQGIGVYAALARGSNRNLVSERSADNWNDGYVRTLIRGALDSDRLWMQASAYGPPAPWSDGFPVRRITRCASVA